MPRLCPPPPPHESRAAEERELLSVIPLISYHISALSRLGGHETPSSKPFVKVRELTTDVTGIQLGQYKSKNDLQMGRSTNVRKH